MSAALVTLGTRTVRPCTAARKVKTTRGLGNTGFTDEARAALCDALQGMGSALAVERRLPEPAELKDVLQPPLMHSLGEALPVLRDFVQDATCAWKPVAERLASDISVSVKRAPGSPSRAATRALVSVGFAAISHRQRDVSEKG